MLASTVADVWLVVRQHTPQAPRSLAASPGSPIPAGPLHPMARCHPGQEACEQRVDWLNREHSTAILLAWLSEVVKTLRDYGHERDFIIAVLLSGLPLSKDCPPSLAKAIWFSGCRKSSGTSEECQGPQGEAMPQRTRVPSRGPLIALAAGLAGGPRSSANWPSSVGEPGVTRGCWPGRDAVCLASYPGRSDS